MRSRLIAPYRCASDKANYDNQLLFYAKLARAAGMLTGAPMSFGSDVRRTKKVASCPFAGVSGN